MFSFFNESSSGDGRKSATILKSPIGSSLYRIVLLINLLSFSPVAGSDNTDSAKAICKSYCQNSAAIFIQTEAIVAFLFCAMAQIFSYNAILIQECILSLEERYSVFSLVCLVLGFIPFKARFAHLGSIAIIWLNSHIAISPLTPLFSGRSKRSLRRSTARPCYVYFCFDVSNLSHSLQVAYIRTITNVIKGNKIRLKTNRR